MRQNTNNECFDASPFYFRLYSLIAFLYSATAIYGAQNETYIEGWEEKI